jgi:F0F1-type ATP synthase alpha subunit
MLLYAGTSGLTDPIAVPRMRDWQVAFLRYMATQYPAVGEDIVARKALSPENEQRLKEAIQLFNQSWS